MYAYGQGVKEDFVIARELFTMACDGQNSLGCNLLGYIYRDAMGVKANKAKAQALFKKACALGNQDGCNNVKGKNK